MKKSIVKYVEIKTKKKTEDLLKHRLALFVSVFSSQQSKTFYEISVFSCFDFHRFYLRDTIFKLKYKNLNVLYEFD